MEKTKMRNRLREPKKSWVRDGKEANECLSEQETNRIRTCSHCIFGITHFPCNFLPNYMNYLGFWFNVLVINIFRIGIFWRTFSMCKYIRINIDNRTHTCKIIYMFLSLSLSWNPLSRNSKRKRRYQCYLILVHYDLRKYHSITIKQCSVNYYGDCGKKFKRHLFSSRMNGKLVTYMSFFAIWRRTFHTTTIIFIRI